MITENKESLEKYEEVYQRALNEKEKFWAEEAKEVTWIKDPNDGKILDDSNLPFARWFQSGTLNMCYNVLDRHIELNRGETPAVIWESAYLNKSLTFTYNDMYSRVNKLSKILLDNGIEKGDRVIIYMPMIPEFIFAMLACCRIGAIHSVVFGGFAAPELASRIKDTKPKMLITASLGIEPRKKVPYYPMVLEALGIAECPDLKIILVQRPDVYQVSQEELSKHNYTLIYQEEMDKLSDDIYTAPVEVESTHPLYILYTSGTSQTPKGVVRDTGGNCVITNYTMKYIMNVDPGDVAFSSNDIAWVVGHLYIVYGPLLRGATTVMLEGKPVGTPNPGKCWEIIEKYKVKTFFTSPIAMRALKREDTDYTWLKKYDLSSLESLQMAGERLDPDTFIWLQEGIGKDKLINDQWGQTESGWPICSNSLRTYRFISKAGSVLKPQPGFVLKILDVYTDEEIPTPNVLGKICFALPLPPGCLLTIWGNDDAYLAKYIIKMKYYFSGDCGYFDEDGDFFIMTRLDDIIKISGHRLATGRMEEVLNLIPEIAESAVVGVRDELKGEVPFAFLICNQNVEEKDYPNIIEKAKEKIVTDIGAISRLKGALICKRLPKTRSGKIIRAILKSIINKDKPEIPPTIESELVIDEIIEQIKSENI